ncbi:unnamed protein product [Prorocentrum cordatum]|uniref:Cellulase n=1 Tax=Prorocentrum cordatum TaxID=2364126 RepID=A0ABN9USK7_9DINO|nr:unnamed protein product [Polarella glacialis]
MRGGGAAGRAGALGGRAAAAAAAVALAAVAAPGPASLQWSRDFDLLQPGAGSDKVESRGSMLLFGFGLAGHAADPGAVRAVQYFEQKFYEGGVSVLSDGDLEQVEGLRLQAMQEPVLALAAAQVLYMFGWFRSTGEVIRGNVVASAQLFEQSISAGGCGSDAPKEVWHDNACDMRWMHSALLYRWLGDTEGDAERGRVYREKAQQLSQEMRWAAAHAEAGELWSSPLHLNFNSMIFPGKPSH